jgi:hypothetical protein
MARGSWTGTIAQILDSVQYGITYEELRKRLQATTLGAPGNFSEKSFYGAVGRLEANKLAVRHNGRVFSKKGYEAFRKAVEIGIEDDTPVSMSGRKRSPARDAIMAALGCAEGMKMSEILDLLKDEPGLNVQSKNGKTAIYNLIAREVGRGDLVKDSNGVIRLPGTSGAEKGKASDTRVSEASH